EALSELLRFVDCAQLVVVQELGYADELVISAWNGSATVNTALVGPGGFTPVDCWTHSGLPDLSPNEREMLLRVELYETLLDIDEVIQELKQEVH
ncbi:MAG: hypothetical protein ACKN9R_02135, partial [Candidatus Limnocylindrus sp.]